MATKDNLNSFDKYKQSSYESYNFKMPEIYDDNFWMKFFKNNLWDDAIISQLGNSLQSISILDVGCATGRLLRRLALAGLKKLSGSDLAPNILEVARRRLVPFDIDLKVADAETELPWAENTFDFVTLTGVFHHFYRPQHSLQEIYRVLKTGGRLILIEPWFPPIIRHITNFYLLFFNHDGDCKFHSPSGLKKLTESAKLKTVELNRIARFSFMIVSQKKI